jgi:hypothetical protein
MVVFSHFSLEDIVYVSLVCKAWNTYFDTKQIWKQIYELNFGVVYEKSVDLSQNMRWKRLVSNNTIMIFNRILIYNFQSFSELVQ